MNGGKLHRGVAGVEPGGGIALVEGRLFFIHYYQAQGFEGQKQAAACAEQNVGFAAAHAVCCKPSACRGNVGPVFYQRLAEIARETLYKPFCRVFIGHQQQHSTSACQTASGQGKVFFHTAAGLIEYRLVFGKCRRKRAEFGIHIGPGDELGQLEARPLHLALGLSCRRCLVNLPYRAEVVAGDEAPELYFTGRDGRQLRQQFLHSGYALRGNVRLNVHRRNNAHIASAGEDHAHAVANLHPDGGIGPVKAITRLPLQAEWEYHLNVALFGHYLRVPSSAALIMASLAVT